MKKLCSGLFFVFISSFAFAQFQVIGQVKDEDGVPYSGMRVEIDGTEYSTETDEIGNYQFDNVPAGDYAVVFFHEYGAVYRALYLEQDEFFDVNIRRRIEFDEVLVKSSRILDETPMNREDVNQEEISAFNFGQDVPYLFKSKRSVVVTSDAGTGIGYTGIRIRGVDPSHVNVSINGIPLNDAESQLTFWVDLPDLLSSTENIQVQRGLGPSSIGGADLGASLNLNTNKIQTKSYLNVKASMGSFNTYKGTIQLGTGLMNGRYSLDGRYSFAQSDGYIDRASADLRSFQLSAAYVGLTESYRFNVINGHEVTYQAWNGVPVNYVDDDELRTFNSAGTEKSLQDPYEDEVDNYTQTHLQFFYNKILEDNDFNLALHYTRGLGFFELYKADQSIDEIGLPKLDTISISDLVQRRWLDNHFYGLNTSYNFNSEKFKWTIGAAATNYNGGHYRTIEEVIEEPKYTEDYTYLENDATKFDANAFIRLHYNLAPNIYAYGDLQYRFVNYQYQLFEDDDSLIDKSEDFGFLNPKAGVTYLNNNSRIFASIAVGNKEPNRDDFRDAGPDSQPKSERLINYEIGYELNRDNWQTAIYGYYMDYQDQLVLTGKINDVGEYARANVDNSYRLGMEVEFNGNIDNALSWQLNANLSQNRIDDFEEYIDDWDTGEQVVINHGETDLAFSPSVVANANLTYHFGRHFHIVNDNDNLSLTIANNYVGSQFLDNTSNESAQIDAYLTTDLTLSYELSMPRIKSMRWQFKVVNLFDQKYVTNGWLYRFQSSDPDAINDNPYGRSEGNNRFNLTGLFPQAGLHFFTGIDFRF